MTKDNKTSIVTVSEETVGKRIYVVRGQKVMLDKDLAQIYGYETRYLNQQVKRNMDKFEGEDFMFQLTQEELKILMLQNVTSSSEWGGTRKRPFAFTESGIYMLMTVLKGDLAVRQSRELIRLFRQMKDYILESQGSIGRLEIARLAMQTNENTKAIRKLEANVATKDDLQNFIASFYDEHLGKEFLLMDGQTIEAAVAYEAIYTQAKRTVYIIDNYVGIKTLLPLRDIAKNVVVTVFTDNLGMPLRQSELIDFQREYPRLKISFKKTCGKFHDRFIVLDYKTDASKVYHCGCSSKDAGKKVTLISKLDDVQTYSPMIEELAKNPPLVLK